MLQTCSGIPQMKDHKKILTLIENVDPLDNDALDEIDARVWCWLEDCKFKRMLNNKYPTLSASKFSFYEDDQIYYKLVSGIRYCTSRDALKAIRPDGWQWYLVPRDDNLMVRFGGALDCVGTGQLESPSLPTEELAELHAIIQAIAWERQNDGTV